MRRLVFATVTAILISACAPTNLRMASGPEVVIDMVSKRATGPGWGSEILDCSDANFRCLEAPGHFLLAFPRKCPSGSLQWIIGGFQFRMTAPAPHYALPSGGYVSGKYPHVHLHYFAAIGFTSYSIHTGSVIDGDWAENRSSDYRIRFKGDSSPFRCLPNSTS